MKTNARQTVSGVWADATSTCIQTLDACSKTFGRHYTFILITGSEHTGVLIQADRYKRP